MIVFQFPGQSSVQAGMVEAARAAHPDAFAEVFDTAREALGEDVSTQLGGDGVTRDNRAVQLGVFLTSLVHLRALEAIGVTAQASLGLSLGEYTHLVHIGALSLEDGVRLVARRGELYDQGPAGVMAAVFPVELSELEELVARFEGLAITNYNSPTQHVVAGPAEQVEALGEVIEDELFAECRVIEERIPMHHPLFRPVAERFSGVLERVDFCSEISMPYRPNVTAEVLEEPTLEQVRALLARHVCEPVLWRRSIEVLVQAGGHTFWEVGPGRVLTGLLSRRWVKVERRNTDVR